MDSAQVSIPIAPSKQPGDVEDLYEAAWELLAETIGKNAKHKSARAVLGEYLPDTRQDGRGASTPKELRFVFLSPASACDVQMAVTAHWFELAAAVAASELAAVCAANGFELRAPKQTALSMANAPRALPFVPNGEAIVGVVRGKEPSIRIDSEGDVSLDEAELAPAAKKLVRAAIDSGVCACPFCDKIRAKKAVAAKPKKAKPAKATKPGELPKLEHFTSLAKAMKSPDRVGTIEVPDKGHAENVIPEDIGKLQRLTYLRINGYVTRLPASLFELRALEGLHVSSPRADIPDALGELTKLQRLRISGARIPETIGRLTELTSLSLQYSSARVIPEALTKLTKLVTLELTDLMGIEEPLPNLGALTALKTLRISTARGTFGAGAVPDLRLENVDFSALKSLVTLELHNVAAFPATLHDMPALEELKVGRAEGEWPDAFDTLPALKRLTAENVGWKAWPRTLNDLPNLQALAISGPQLRSLEGLRSLPALENLSVGGEIDRLPAEAPHLPALKWLRIRGLDHLPGWLAELPALTSLSVPKFRGRQEEADALMGRRAGLTVTG